MALNIFLIALMALLSKMSLDDYTNRKIYINDLLLFFMGTVGFTFFGFPWFMPNLLWVLWVLSLAAVILFLISLSGWITIADSILFLCCFTILSLKGQLINQIFTFFPVWAIQSLLIWFFSKKNIQKYKSLPCVLSLNLTLFLFLIIHV